MTLRSGDVYFSEQNDSFAIPETISVFGFSISFYGLFLVLAVLIGIVVVIKETRRRQQDIERSLTLITLVILSAVVGARLYYVIFHWQVFAEEPVTLLHFRSGGLSYYGAVLAAWFLGRQWCKRKKLSFGQYADILCLGAAAATPLIWLGCAFVREPMGRFYDGVFSLRIGAEYMTMDTQSVSAQKLAENTRMLGDTAYVSVHPVALYGAVITLVIFVLLFFLKGRLKQPGNVFSLYLLLNAVSCFVLELFRADRCCIWGTKLPANCVMATVLVLSVAIDWIWHRPAKKKAKKRFLHR